MQVDIVNTTISSESSDGRLLRSVANDKPSGKRHLSRQLFPSVRILRKKGFFFRMSNFDEDHSPFARYRN